MAKFRLTEVEKEQIKDAVKSAESKTSGEISTAIIKESCDYSFYELVFAIAAAFCYFAVMLFFASSVDAWLQSFFWDSSGRYLIAFYGFSSFLVISIVYFLDSVFPIDRLIVPKKIMAEKVSQRALRHFMESGLCNTKDRTGILVFVSVLEHRVELIADMGISEKVAQKEWEDIVSHIIDGIKKDSIAKNLCQSIARCGDLLEKHFPIQPDDINELSDDIQILEK